MFRRSLVKLAATAVKQTTGITGIPVVPNAREVLISLYRRTIDIAEQYVRTLYFVGSCVDMIVRLHI